MLRMKQCTLWVIAMIGLLTLLFQQSRAETQLEEDFSTDVIASGDWIAGDASVSVDTENGWLHIAADGDYSDGDCADKPLSLTLPIVVETRMRLVSGGQNYTLPALGLYYGPTNNEADFITYLPGSSYGWKFMDSWTDVHTMGPVTENVWMTIRAIIRSDGGELLAKGDEDTEFTAVTSATWSIPSDIVKLRLVSHWDAVCDFDYVKVTTYENTGWCDGFESYQNPSDWTQNWHGSGNVGGIALDNTTAFTGLQSLRMFGLLGSCWGAVATRPIQMDLPLEISFAMKNGSEPLSGCHPYRGVFALRTGGPDWWNCPCPGLLVTLPNGDIQIPQQSGAEVFSGYALDTWHSVRCILWNPADGFLHMKFWVNGGFLGEFTLSYESWMSGAAYFDISANEGTAWFDNVCVAPAVLSMNVALDIKPGSCPNPLNVNSGHAFNFGGNLGEMADQLSKPKPGKPEPPAAVVPVAILGTEDFDVSAIVPSSILLEGIPALRWNVEDVATPVGDNAAECECNTLGADGHPDLTLKFSRDQLIKAVGDVQQGDVVPLTISGELSDGTPFEGQDCMVIVGGLSGPQAASSIEVMNSYPNPFNPTTTIAYSVSQAGPVALEIYNVLGEKVRTLVDQFKTAGDYEVTWDSRNDHGEAVSTDVYFYRLRAGDLNETKKMVLMK